MTHFSTSALVITNEGIQADFLLFNLIFNIWIIILLFR